MCLVLLGLLLAACGSNQTTGASAGNELVEESVPDDSGTIQPEPESTESASTESASTEPPAEPENQVAESAAADPALEEISTLPEELRGVLETTTGDQVDLASFRGEDVVLWFWAPW